MGLDNSSYHIAITTWCRSYLVEDDELNDVYFDPEDLSKAIDIVSRDICPIYGSNEWDYTQLIEWPKE